MATLEQLGLSDPITDPDECYLEVLRHLRQLRSPDCNTNTRKEGPHSPGPARASTRGNGNGNGIITTTTNADFTQDDHHHDLLPPARIIRHSAASCRRCRQQPTTATADRAFRPRRICRRNTPFLNTYTVFLADHRTALINILRITLEPREPSVVITFPQS